MQCRHWLWKLINKINGLGFFCAQPEDLQQQIIRETFHLVSKRDDNVCNFLEGGTYVLLLNKTTDPEAVLQYQNLFVFHVNRFGECIAHV